MYNSVKTLVEQAKTIPNTFATIITFDEAINVLVDKIPVAEVTIDNLRPGDFQPRGQTSLYDAIMLCFDKINNQNDAKQDGEKLREKPGEKPDRTAIEPCNTFITIVTDGQDNSSHNTREQVRQRAEELWAQGVQGKFLGAQGHAMHQGKRILSLGSDHVLEYDVSEDAVQSLSQTLSASMAHYYRTGNSPAFSDMQRSAATPRRPPRNMSQDSSASFHGFQCPPTPSRRQRHFGRVDSSTMVDTLPAPSWGGPVLRTNLDGVFDDQDVLINMNSGK